jgi:ketosteroid isomerase-like protein
MPEEPAMPEEPTMPDPQEGLDALNRGDVDAALTKVATDCVWDAGSLGVFEGKDVVRTFIEDWRRAYDGFQVQVEGAEYLGNGVTYGVLLERGRPKNTSGVFVEHRHAVVFLWRDGLIERYTHYANIYKARAAAERLAEERG